MATTFPGGGRIIVLLALALLAGCASLPSLDGRTTSTVLVAGAGTPLHDFVAPELEANPGRSAIYPLRDGESAYAARIALIDGAVRSLDVQYYIWHDDLTGRLLLDALRRAADRGVRVRLLLDDNGIAGLDPLLAALDAHPNVEVRLFNPFLHRKWRVLGYLTDFRRLNRRMHNKSLTADGLITIVGGRNVGDEYFGVADDLDFVDLDVAAAGDIVPAVGRSFDAYWASDSAYPADRVLRPATPAALARLAALGDEARRLPAAERFDRAVRDTPVLRPDGQRWRDVEWARARLVVDDPAKGLGRSNGDEHLLARLEDAFDGPPQREIAIVSPYFVPGRGGTRSFVDYARRGVQVRILTNALEATDVAAVHAGYAKRRRALLEGGVELFEMKREAGAALARMLLEPRGRRFRLFSRSRRTAPAGNEGTATASAAPATPAPGSTGAGDAATGSVVAGSAAGSSGAPRGSGRSGSRGSSGGTSLHAKTFAVDDSRLFVGSFNFDLRSARLNTEMGIVIDSPGLAQQLSDAFDSRIPRVSYRVRLDGHGRVEWVEQRDGREIVQQSEPGAGLLKRAMVGLLSLLPIDWLL